jgi:hypothetical protein
MTRSSDRSGIGASQILRKNDVQQVVDLPGVGEHLMGLCQDLNEDFPLTMVQTTTSVSRIIMLRTTPTPWMTFSGEELRVPSVRFLARLSAYKYLMRGCNSVRSEMD